MNLVEEAESVLARAERAIFDNHEEPARPAPAPPGLFTRVLDFDVETVEAALGATGLHIRAFAESADLQHPDLANLADGRLSAESNFSRTGIELLELTRFARERQLPLVVQNFPKLFARNDSHGFVSLRISDPAKSSCNNARFIGDPEKREAIRKRKTSQDISLYSFYQKKVDTWDTLPDSFGSFVRNSTPYGEDIARLTRRIGHFERCGLEANAAKMRDRLDGLQAASTEQYYGFNRCPIGVAVVILAKSHGFVLSGSKTTSQRIRVGQEMLQTILADRVIGAAVHDLAGKEYQPRLYVAGSLRVPDRMKRIMDHLDAFPAAAGKPIFDHFCVLVPSLTKCHDEAAVRVDVGDKHRDMDHKLVAACIARPILLGECDGKQYFISYWY